MVCIAAFIILALIGVFVAIISIFKPKVGKAYWKMFSLKALGLFKGVSTFDFAGAYAALYQLFWMIPILGISLINIKK